MLRVCLRMAVSSAAQSRACCSGVAAAAAEHVAPRRRLHTLFSTIALPSRAAILSPQMSTSSSQVRQRSVTAPCLCEPEGFESGIIRGAAVKYNDSAALRLRRRALLQWQPGAPSKVLIVKKPKNPAASAKLREIGQWLAARGVQVFVERVVWATEAKEFSVFDPRVNRNDIDFCITLGGDGTVLYMTSLFEEDEPLPPTLCFAMGSLGFLTPFDAAAFAPTLERVMDTRLQPLHCTLRTRKRCEVVHEGRLEAVHHVLNECVLDRGSFPGAVLLEIFVDGSYVSNVEADGLIISTPSGSTAYSMSAGGPVVAPSVPCTVLTPIAPLSLSFRPVILPESSSLCVHLPTCARSHARASFDGKRPMRVRRGSSIFFTTSLCPLPLISLGRMDTDWYEGITSKLKWNQAIRQLPSCPSPVGTRQQELCSARHADRTAAADAEYCSVSDAVHWDAAAAVAAAAARARNRGSSGNGGVGDNGNGNNGNAGDNGNGRGESLTTAVDREGGAAAGVSSGGGGGEKLYSTTRAAAESMAAGGGGHMGFSSGAAVGAGGSLSRSYSNSMSANGGSVTDSLINSLDEQQVEDDDLATSLSEALALVSEAEAGACGLLGTPSAAAEAAACAVGTPRRAAEGEALTAGQLEGTAGRDGGCGNQEGGGRAGCTSEGAGWGSG